MRNQSATIGLAITLFVSVCLGEAVQVDSHRVEIAASVSPNAELAVRRVKNGAPLMGTFDRLVDRLVFHPTLPLPVNQRYLFEWQEPGGELQRVEFAVPRPGDTRPTVTLQPSGVPFPANALRFYLHFSEPMEQGVFLDRIRLIDSENNEVEAPFRETELWSPDGTRLTVWFHPGRQKQGVNLNEDEGPVLMVGEQYHIVVEGSWRSAKGTSLKKDTIFRFLATESDHGLPNPMSMDIVSPPVGSRTPLIVRFSEPLDTAMLHSALRVTLGPSTLFGLAEPSPSGTEWTFTPTTPWAASKHHLEVASNLEDLAGNSFEEPFEKDLKTKTSTRPSNADKLKRAFTPAPSAP